MYGKRCGIHKIMCKSDLDVMTMKTRGKLGMSERVFTCKRKCRYCHEGQDAGRGERDKLKAEVDENKNMHGDVDNSQCLWTSG